MQKSSTFSRSLVVVALVSLSWATGSLSPTSAAEEPRPLTGTVTETMNSGGYTYLLLDTGKAKVWVATTPVVVKVGCKVETPSGLQMKQFFSSSLKRTFEEIIFVDGIIIDGQKQNTSISRKGERSPAPVAPPPAFSGKIVEVLDGGKYTFLRVQGFHNTIWVATKPCSLKAGEQVSMPHGEVMPNFRSTTLNRTFDEIHFVDHLDLASSQGHAPASGSGAALPAGHPQIAGQTKSALPPKLSGPIQQPAGGKTIAEIFAQRKTLAGQEVTVKGQVTKFSASILGRNWIHLADGTGEAGSNDLTVTSADTAAVGDIVTARGKLVIDQDFGFGYAYSVLLEKATVQKN